MLLIILFINAVYSQDKERKSQWKLTTEIGSVSLEAKNKFKVNASLHGGLIGGEFFVGRNTSLITGIEIIRARANFNDVFGNQQFLTNEYITIPLSFKFSGNREKNIFLFYSAGIYGAYLYKNRTEDVLNSLVITEKRLGFNFGIHYEIGTQFKINEKSNFTLAFKSKTDLLNYYYKASSQVFKMTEYYTLQLGFGFSF